MTRIVTTLVFLSMTLLAAYMVYRIGNSNDNSAVFVWTVPNVSMPCPVCTTVQPQSRPQQPLPPSQSASSFYTTLSLEETVAQRSPTSWQPGAHFDVATMAFADPDVIHRRYAAFHQAATARVLHAGNTTLRRDEIRKLGWVVVNPVEGWGNMAREVVSGYIIAVISGRILLVDWPTQIPVQKFLHAPELPDLCNADLIRAVRQSAESVFVLDTPTIQNKSPERVLWPEVASTTHKHHLLEFNSSIPLAQEYFMLNPHYGALVVPLATTPYAARVIHALLFQPTARLSLIMDDASRALAAAEFAVGVHARTGESDNSQWASESYWADFLQCVDATVHAAAEHNVSLRVFVATDSQGMLERIRKLVGLDKTVTLDGAGRIAHIQTISADEDALGRIIGDWWLLGEADELIGSYLSSFSYTAQRRTGLRAYHLAGDTPDNAQLAALGLRPNKPARCKDVFPDVVSA